MPCHVSSVCDKKHNEKLNMADIVESLHLNVPDVPDVHLHMLGTPVQSYK